MPVEIRELIIRATVTPEPEDAPPVSQAQPRPPDTEAMIQECVKQVLRILKKKEER
jgi:hypothetical protein